MKRKLTFLLIAFLLLTGSTSWGQLRTVITDQLDREFTGITGSSYISWEGKTSNSDAVYAGLSAGGNESIQLRSNNSNSGIITTASGGMVTNVTVIWNENTAENRTLQVYGSHTAYTSPTELYSDETYGDLLGTIVKGESVELEISGSYEYVGLRSSSGAMYLTEIDITWNTEGGTPQETVATPTFSPEAGTYSEAVTVSISCATEGATIYYTLDGTNPMEDGTVYTSAINITETTTVKAFAMKEGYLDSGVASATYTISGVPVPSLITIAEARALANDEYALVQGVVTFIDGRNVYIQDETAGIDLFLNSNTVPSALALGDMVQAYGKRANYNGLAELSGINGNDTEQFNILSSGNTLPLVVKTIAEILEDGADALQCTRVKVENATIGAINTNGNTPLTQDGSTINIYKIPALTDIEEGNLVDVVSVIGYFNAPQLRVALASDVVLIETPSSLSVSPMELSGFEYEYEGGGPSEIQSFTLSGELLTHNVNIFPSESFDISTMPAQYFQPENPSTIYIPSSGHFYDIPIYVRMKAGLEVGTYSEQIAVTCEDTGTLYVTVSGTVTGNGPTPPTPVEGEYMRISDINQLVPGSYVVFAARFDENASDYYAMSNSSSGKPEGVLFSSSISEGNEILPASITDEESSFYWVVGVTDNGYTFTNAAGELIGYTSGTNFATGGDNTEWVITIQTSEEGTMVPNYTGFVVGNVNTPVRAFALNSSHNFGPYHTQNMNGANYNFFLDLFVKADGEPPVPPTPTVATPTFTPAAGTYYEPQTVSIACTTSGATIFYSSTSENGPWTEYEEAITVDESTTLWAYAVKEGYNDSNVASATYTIQVGLVTIFSQDWEGDMNGWTFVDVTGEAQWTIGSYQGNHYAYANGYNQGANEDWCISPAFNLDAISNPTLTFRTAKNYNGPDLEVFFSNDYDGSNPSSATWTPLTCALSSGSWTWTESGNISLGGFSGTNCYIGFKYTSGEDSAAGWEADDILLFGQTSAPVVSVTPLALNGFNYTEGNGPSTEQSFTVSGFNLSGNITVTTSTDYEISQTSGSGFTQSPITLAPVGGTVEDATIYIRLKAGLAVGDYNQSISIGCPDVDDILVTCSGTVTAQPIPGDDYVRISDISELVDGSRIIFAARFDENATDYYAMSNTSSGKPTGVLFTSATNEGQEILPASITDEENSFYWTVGVTDNGYTFTNASGELVGWTSGTNFSTDGENTEWLIESATAGDAAMVPFYEGFTITNANTTRGFALNSQHNFGPYAISNNNNSGYNFYLDLFVKAGGEPPVPPTPTVATPIFTPAGGTYYEVQEVTISCATDGATIYYSTVSENGPWSAYTEAITVEETSSIWAYATKEGYNDSPVAEATYTIQLGMVTIFNQDWEGDMNGWTFVTVVGDNPWTVGQYQGNHYAYANGYNGGVNEQWCISPGFNMHDYDNVFLSFRNAKNYIGPDLELKYSTNYDGGDPTAATWWTFDFNMSPGSYTWVESGDIHISITPYPAHDCYIAFKYTSTENEAAAWEVDDILLVGTTSVPNITATPNSLSGFTHVVGEGPSESQYFTLSGVNIGPAPGGGSTGSILMQVSGNAFEISLDNETFSWQQSIDSINGTLPPTPVYVRLNGTEVGQYTATVEIYASSSDETTVTLSGTVTEPPVPGGDYVRISDVSQLTDGNRVILASRYNETSNAYYALTNTLTSGHLSTVEFTSVMDGTDEIIPESLVNTESDYYWTVGITADGYTFTNANGDMIGYGTSGTNFVLNGERTVWTAASGVSTPESLVPEYYGFNIINATTDTRAFALRVTETESIVKAYSTSNMTNSNAGEYNFFLDIFMQGEGGEPPTPTVATPTFSPAAGIYYVTQDVIINCTTTDATVYYSLDSGNGPWEEYEEAITVDENMTIWAYATKTGYNDSPVVSAEYIIQNDLVIIFNQDWEDDWNGWTEVCVEGDSLWRIASYQGNHYAYANGYNHPATEDWLISPAFDLDSYDDVTLSFRTAMNYTGPDLELFFSNDYDGQDPTAATWQSLDFEPSQGGWNWVETSISLDGFSGSNCYIGFKYTCTDEDAAGWEVDDIKLASGSTSPNPTLIATPNYLGGFSYVVGNGPSASQSYILSGVNLEDEGEITIVSCSFYEISNDNETFGGVLTFPCTDLPATIYVRMMEGLAPYTYDGVYILNTYAYENDYVYVEVNVSGIVHYEYEPTMSALMPHYIQGNNGSNNNRVPMATPVQFANLQPNTTYRYTNQFVDDNDGPETTGAGNVIYANPEGFYRSTSPSLATEGGYGEFTTDEEGHAMVWLMNEPTANARFTPGNHVYLRVRLNDGGDGTMPAYFLTSEDYATVLNFGTENDEYSGSAFYVKSDEAPMSFAQMYAAEDELRPIYSTSIETIGVDYGSINQYADFYKEEVAGNDGWFGGILPNVNNDGINFILVFDMDNNLVSGYYTEGGQWSPNANTVNPTNGLGDPIFIDLTDVGIEEPAEANMKVWSADHEFVIENGDNAHYNMTVYNILGQPMMTRQINAGSTERISHNLAKGVYVISLQNNQSKVSVKVIVK